MRVRLLPSAYIINTLYLMKFKIEKEVFEKFPKLFVAIPIIYGFNNRWDDENRELINRLKKEYESSLKERFSTVAEYMSHEYIESYFHTFREFGANPKKIKPTHFALGKRVIEGGSLPTINPIVDLYNAMSIKHITPFGGEDLDTVYGDFTLKFANGDEHWLGIGEESGKSPKKGDLIWEDIYDVSTLSLNWRQCERTKLVETSTNGYFIMDGFKGVNEENIRAVSKEFSEFIKNNFGGSYEVLFLDIDNPEAEIEFESKGIDGVQLPMVTDDSKVQESKVEKKSVTFNYQDSSVEREIQAELYKAFEQRIPLDSIDVSITKNSKYGDYFTTVAMRVSSRFGKSPIELAGEIVGKLSGVINKAEVAHPGFINIYVSKDLSKEIINQYNDRYGRSDIGKGKQMMVEFGQPNTHKALQLGHFKSAITGLPIANLYENLGYEVIKANFFGDIGMQVSNCLWGVINRNGTWYSKFNSEDLQEIKDNLESIIESDGIDAAALYLDKSYVLGRNLSEQKESVKEECKDINRKIYEKSDENIVELYEFTRDISIRHQDKAFKELGVEYDVQYPESVVWELGKSIVLENVGKVFVEDAGAIIFEGDKFGLQRWVFLNSEGFPTYSGKDLGLAVKKLKDYPNLDLAIITTSVEQNAYFRAVIKALELIFPEMQGKYKHLGFGWLLFENKKMSSKTGKNVKYTDLIHQANEVARKMVSQEKGYSEEQAENIASTVAMGALKFGILSHEFHKDINWDLDKFMSMTGFAAPYILYTYARGRSILSVCNFEYDEMYKINLEGILENDIELELLKKIGEFPELVKSAGLNISPHLLCRYIYELSDIFNRFYGEFKIHNEENEVVKEGRLRLTHIATDIIKRGMNILGINTVEQM